jgi:phosphatidylinositol glycan class H protein
MRDLLERLASPPAQILYVSQPTPYTATYTVSTRPLPRTISSKIASYVGVLVRLLIGLWIAISLWVFSRYGTEKTDRWLNRILGHVKTEQLLALVDRSHWLYTAPCAFVILLLVFRRNYTGTYEVTWYHEITDKRTEESLTVLRGLGIQTSTTSKTYLQSPTARFIPTTSIQDIFIYEAFKGFEVRFYLAVVVEGEEDVVVVFPTLLPRRAILEEIWRGTRKCLWEGKDELKAREDDARTKGKA